MSCKNSVRVSKVRDEVFISIMCWKRIHFFQILRKITACQASLAPSLGARDLSEKRQSNENPMDRYTLKPFVNPSFDLARQAFTLGCKISAFFHIGDSSLKVSYMFIRYS